MYLTDDIYEGSNEKQVTIAAMIDFESAFDTDLPAALTLQCTKMDIRGKFHQYLYSLLNNKILKMKINQYTSEAININNGMP